MHITTSASDTAQQKRQANQMPSASSQIINKHPRRDSNAGPWLRRPVLYPLSYGGIVVIVP